MIQKVGKSGVPPHICILTIVWEQSREKQSSVYKASQKDIINPKYLTA